MYTVSKISVFLDFLVRHVIFNYFAKCQRVKNAVHQNLSGHYSGDILRKVSQSLLLSLGQNTRYLQLTGGEVYFGHSFLEVSVRI